MGDTTNAHTSRAGVPMISRYAHLSAACDEMSQQVGDVLLVCDVLSVCDVPGLASSPDEHPVSSVAAVMSESVAAADMC